MTSELVAAATALAVLGTRVLQARRRDADGGDHAEENTYGLPDGEPISAELRDWLAKQEAAVLAAIPNAGPLPTEFPDLTADQWVDPMATAMTPVLGAYWDATGKKTFDRLGLDPDDWRVVNPHLEATIRAQALAFSESTNATTTKRLDRALTELRQQLTIGMVEEGESVRELTKRVQYVFENLSTSHARMIAATEASRAVHAAELTADVESEVVAGLELLLSGDACPLCRKIATECKRVRLGESFAVIGSNPHYAQVKHPPLHPHCQCTMIEVLKPEYGGPVDPQWGKTLDQPQKGLGDKYTPPAGEKVPKPEPDRPKPKPTKKPPKAKPEPPAEKTPIDKAVSYAAARGVSVVRDGAEAIKKAFKGKWKKIPAVYRASTGKILLNPESPYWTEPDKVAAEAKASRWWSTDSPEHVIVHEVGHAKHHEAIGDERWRELGAAKLTPAEKRAVAAHVSRYGATDPLEFVAEMYAGQAAGKSYNSDMALLYLKFGGPLP